jgi:hypothetical protein
MRWDNGDDWKGAFEPIEPIEPPELCGGFVKTCESLDYSEDKDSDLGSEQPSFNNASRNTLFIVSDKLTFSRPLGQATRTSHAVRVNGG